MNEEEILKILKASFDKRGISYLEKPRHSFVGITPDLVVFHKKKTHIIDAKSDAECNARPARLLGQLLEYSIYGHKTYLAMSWSAYNQVKENLRGIIAYFELPINFIVIRDGNIFFVGDMENNSPTRPFSWKERKESSEPQKGNLKKNSNQASRTNDIETKMKTEKRAKKYKFFPGAGAKFSPLRSKDSLGKKLPEGDKTDKDLVKEFFSRLPTTKDGRRFQVFSKRKDSLDEMTKPQKVSSSNDSSSPNPSKKKRNLQASIGITSCPFCLSDDIMVIRTLREVTKRRCKRCNFMWGISKTIYYRISNYKTHPLRAPR